MLADHHSTQHTIQNSFTHTLTHTHTHSPLSFTHIHRFTHSSDTHLHSVHGVVVVDAHIQEVALRLGLLQGLNVAHMEQVEVAVHVHDLVVGAGCPVVGELRDAPSGGDEGGDALGVVVVAGGWQRQRQGWREWRGQPASVRASCGGACAC